MKNTIFVLLFLCTFIFTSSAQFSAGIKAGGNFTNVMGTTETGDKVKGHSFIPGFHVGALAEMDLSEFISLQAEAVYSTKGYKEDSKTTKSLPNATITSERKVVCKLSYVDVPLMVNIHFGQMGSYLGIGPQISFLSGVKWDGTITNTTTYNAPPSTKVDEFTDAGNDKTGYSKIDFGGVIGTGAKWESGIEYCLRAGYGLTNVIDPANSPLTDKWHNLVFTVSLGYTFHFGNGGGGDRYGHKYGKKRRR